VGAYKWTGLAHSKRHLWVVTLQVGAYKWTGLAPSKRHLWVVTLQVSFFGPYRLSASEDTPTSSRQDILAELRHSTAPLWARNIYSEIPDEKLKETSLNEEERDRAWEREEHTIRSARLKKKIAPLLSYWFSSLLWESLKKKKEKKKLEGLQENHNHDKFLLLNVL
jgi:hypothetical protein